MKELILDFISKSGITKYKTLKRGTEIMFRCPFHQDTDASLEMNVHTGGWRCYGCGKKGFLPKFIKLLTGEDINLDEYFPIEDRIKAKIRYIYEQSALNILQYEDRIHFLEFCNEEFCNFVDPLKNDISLSYLKGTERKLSNETIRTFKFKFAIRGFYENRIIIPYYKNQSLIGFNARLVGTNKQHGKESRYRYCVNTKDFEGYIYNLENINQNKPTFIVEGPFDLAYVWQCGYKNVISTLNTAIKLEHLENISNINTLIFVFDNDRNSSGFNSVLKGAELILKYFPNKKLFYANLPDLKDPNECSLEELKNSFQHLKRIIIKDK